MLFKFLKCFCDYYMPVSHFQSTGMFLSVLYSFLIAFCRKDFMIGSLDYNHYNLLPETYQICFCLGLSKYSFLCLDAHLLWVLGTLLQLIQFYLQYHSYRGRHPIYTISFCSVSPSSCLILLYPITIF